MSNNVENDVRNLVGALDGFRKMPKLLRDKGVEIDVFVEFEYDKALLAMSIELYNYLIRS